MFSGVNVFNKIGSLIRVVPKKKSLIIILSGPSAIGKSTVAALLLKNYPNMKRVITATSRKPRSYETKADYIFFYRRKV